MGIKLDNFPTALVEQKKSKTSKRDNSFSSWMNKDIQLFGNGLGLKQKETFYSELYILLSAGLDIKKALNIISDNKKKKKEKALSNNIEEIIINGASLSEAMYQTGKFSDYEIYSIQIGEESGQLIPVLKELNLFYTRSSKYKQQLITALAYPCFVIGFSFLVVFFLLKYLVPLFSDIYKKFDGTLPPITQKIIDLSDWLGSNGGMLFFILLVLSLVLYQQRNKVWLRKVASTFVMRLPVFGSIIQKIYLGRFAQSMFLLLNAKVPLLKATGLVRKMVGFYPIENSLDQTQEDILQGSLLHASLRKSSFFSSQFIAMIQVGEEASNLDQMFAKLSGQYSEEVEQQTALISSLIEPILIISLGIIVGIILIAMYMPLFQMSVGVG